MKYSFSGRSPLDIIRNYKIIDNEIIITYLMGLEEKIPFTIENEKHILEEMLMQAKERCESFSIELEKTSRNASLSLIISYSSLTFTNILNLLRTNSQSAKAISGLAITLLSISVILSGYKYIKKNTKIRDVEKYNIYLEIKEKLDGLNNSLNSSIPFQLEKNGMVLNINTLDDFSLHNLKKFRKLVIDRKEKQINNLGNKPKVKKLAR